MSGSHPYHLIASVLSLGNKPAEPPKAGPQSDSDARPSESSKAGPQSDSKARPSEPSKAGPQSDSEARQAGGDNGSGGSESIDNAVLRADRQKVIRAIESGEVDWERVVFTGSNNYVLQAFYLKILEHDLIGLLPAELADHLKELYDLNLARNNTILEHTERINKLLKSNGITPVFMKGLGNMLDGLYSSPGERMMLDIDILADPEKMEDAARLLIDDGFTSVQQYDPARKPAMKHFPELVKDGLPAFVDIHRMPVNIQYESHFNYQTAVSDQRPARNNPDYMVMSDSHKITLNFIHSQLVHWGHQHAHPSLRDLYDLLLLNRREDAAAVLNAYSPFRGKAAGYLRVFYRTFGINKELPKEMKKKGRMHLARHKIAMDSPRSGKLMFSMLRGWRQYLEIPLRSLFDKNYRLYVKVRLRDPEWYKRNLGVRKFFKKKS